MAAATVWPPPTPVLGQLGISLGPGMIESVMASVDSGRIKYLTIGMYMELRYSLIDVKSPIGDDGSDEGVGGGD